MKRLVLSALIPAIAAWLLTVVDVLWLSPVFLIFAVAGAVIGHFIIVFEKGPPRGD